ncbi:hypothetical protein BH10BAC5_BH10BAC5_14750 [soil metagenome]
MKKTKLFINIAVMLCLVVICYMAFTTNVQSEKSNKELTQQKFSQVRIFAKNLLDMNRLQQAGFFLDHSTGKLGEYRDAWLSENELNSVKISGVPYQILIEDWAEYYENQPRMSEAEVMNALNRSKIESAVSHSVYGSMGGFLTYAEVVNKLDSMRIQYPTLVSAKWSLVTTLEGRQQWTVRITKNPDVTTGRPEVWYHALIHAREPESMTHELYYMYWLLENYNIDPLATYILNNREIYWTPFLNPDGYAYNQTTNPTGGGMWRANRHITTGACGPVDPNRNYGVYAYWNSTNNGSSTDPCNGGSGTYRGTAPFSELETQGARDFVASRNFKTIFGAHTYGNYIIKPWAWSDPSPTPDDAKFNEYLADMTATNGYTKGSPSQTVGYFVRGGADDFYYGDSVHGGVPIIAMTPETGTTGFWPTQAEIIPLSQKMLFSDQYMSLIAGAYVYPMGTAFNQPTYTQGGSGSLKVNFKNKGLAAATNVKIELLPVNNGYVTIPVSFYTRASMPAFSNPDSVTFNFTISGAVPNNYAIPVQLKIKQDTNTVYTQNLYVIVGGGSYVLLDSAENGFSNWATNGTWAVTNLQSHSPVNSFTDSPAGNYQNNTNNSMTLNLPLNASNRPVYFLEFWHRYATEAGYDFCNVEVSNDNGVNWQSVKTYNGTLSTWTFQSFDITSYAANSANVRVRFRLTSDANTTADGWYVDDIKIRNYSSTSTGITYNSSLVPEKFSISQNYPNPFNPSTKINYALALNTIVKIRIYDMLGKEVQTLVDANQPAGSYTVDFNASALSSGIYYYSISTPQFNETKKMMLVK